MFDLIIKLNLHCFTAGLPRTLTMHILMSIAKHKALKLRADSRTMVLRLKLVGMV